MIRFKEINYEKISDIYRVYISGSSASGKTHFAWQFLKSNLTSFTNLVYFHPDFHEKAPVNWDETITENIVFHAGIPDLKYLLDIPEYSCLIFDDLFSQCCESKDIDYLFRVLSSKRKLSCIIMTQRYFADSKLGLSIRNSCNYHVLMNNADARTNLRVANYMQLKDEINVAIKENSDKPYPYIFLDKTSNARVTGLQVYIDIFSKYKQVIIKSMKYFLIPESDFKSKFEIRSNSFAVENGRNSKSNQIEKSGEEVKSGLERSQRRRKLKKEIEQVIQRYKFRSSL